MVFGIRSLEFATGQPALDEDIHRYLPVCLSWITCGGVPDVGSIDAFLSGGLCHTHDVVSSSCVGERQ